MFLDIGVGLIVAVFTGLFFDVATQKFLFLGWGVFSSLIPDLDYLIWIIKKRRENLTLPAFLDHEHRDLLHYPLLYLLVGVAVWPVFPSFKWVLVWWLGSFFHLVHDTLQDGWGIRWLYPFNKNYFTLASYSPQKVITSKKEQRKLALQYGDENWLENKFQSLNWTVTIEILVLASGLGIVWWWVSL